MSSSLIFMTTPTTSTVLTNGVVPLTTVVRRRGCFIENGTNSVILNRPGYYKVTATITFTAPAAGDVILQLQKNGNAVPGITASGTVTTATTEINTLVINGIVRVFCNEGVATLTIVDTGIGITTSNVSLTVDYID